MRMVRKYEDGSYCVAFNLGDQVTLYKDYALIDFKGRIAKVIPAGTMVTIVEVRHSCPCSPGWNTCMYDAVDSAGAHVYGRYSSAFSVGADDLARIDAEYTEEG